MGKSERKWGKAWPRWAAPGTSYKEKILMFSSSVPDLAETPSKRLWILLIIRTPLGSLIFYFNPFRLNRVVDWWDFSFILWGPQLGLSLAFPCGWFGRFFRFFTFSKIVKRQPSSLVVSVYYLFLFYFSCCFLGRKGCRMGNAFKCYVNGRTRTSEIPRLRFYFPENSTLFLPECRPFLHLFFLFVCFHFALSEMSYMQIN